MTLAFAKTKFVRVPPQKARTVAGLIRGRNAVEAVAELSFCKTKAALMLKKTLLSAIANAESRFEVSRDNLVVNEVRVDTGPSLKRSKPRCRGGRSPILKRTSHFIVAVAQVG